MKADQADHLPADGDSDAVSLFFFILSPRWHSHQPNTSIATTTKIVLSDSIGNAASAGLDLICERVNTSWIKQCSLHNQEEPDGTSVSLRGSVNKREWKTQVFTLDRGLTLSPAQSILIWVQLQPPLKTPDEDTRLKQKLSTMQEQGGF